MSRTRISRFRDRLHRDDGFGLLEVMAVLLVVGILAAVVMARMGDNRDRAHDTALRADMRTVINTIEDIRADTGDVPLNLADLRAALPENQMSPTNMIFAYWKDPVNDGRYAVRLRNTTTMHELRATNGKIEPLIVP